MTGPVASAALPPDLRFAALEALALPGVPVVVGGLTLRGVSTLPAGPAIPDYLRYADRRSAFDIVDAVPSRGLHTVLAEALQGVDERAFGRGLASAVQGLAAVDDSFRATGLWRGNIYLAGAQALKAVLGLIGEAGVLPLLPDLELALRELHSLELVYLFPVAPKFRGGAYDGQVQYRLNGWGRALAHRLAGSDAGRERAELASRAITAHLVQEREAYGQFLSGLDLVRQDYERDQLALALQLPVPVLV